MDIEELFFMILYFVDIKDIINSCRLVSKKWSNAISRYRFKEMIIYSNSNYKLNHSWFYSWKPINSRNFVCSYGKYNNHGTPRLFFDSPSTINCFKSLKYFKLFMNGFNVSQLNSLPNLEHIDLENTLYFSDTVKLNLANLRVLKMINFNGKLIVNSNKLEALHVYCLKTIEIVKSETVRHIEDCLSSTYTKFPNLEVYENRRMVDREILGKMPHKIKEIHLKGDYSHRFQDSTFYHYFEAILQNRKRFQMKVDIYFQGIRIEKLINFKLDPQIDNLRALYECNEHLEDKLHWVTIIDYNSLMQLNNQNLPVSFLKKLNNIQDLISKGAINQEQFVQFLSFCPNLRSLELSYPGFNQEFYENLSGNFNALMQIQFEENEQLNLEFVLKFRLLTDIVCNQNVNAELLESIISKLNVINNFKFVDNSYKVRIFRLDEHQLYDLKYANNRTICSLHKDELVNKFRILKEKFKSKLKSSYDMRKRARIN